MAFKFNITKRESRIKSYCYLKEKKLQGNNLPSKITKLKNHRYQVLFSVFHSQ